MAPVESNVFTVENAINTQTRTYGKDNSLGYSVSNCVVCCHRCNDAKSNGYSYEQWFGMTAYFRKIT